MAGHSSASLIVCFWKGLVSEAFLIEANEIPNEMLLPLLVKSRGSTGDLTWKEKTRKSLDRGWVFSALETPSGRQALISLTRS